MPHTLARFCVVPLGIAVHAHEQYPYLGRFHGFLQDAFVMALPPELELIMRRLLTMPPPEWEQPLLDELCVVARSDQALPEERALARLLVFEGIRVNLTMVAYRTHGHFEGIGGCRRDLDRVADKDLANLLAIPQSVDASTPYRPFTTTVAAAIAHLRDHVDGLRAAQKLIDELRTACEDRARLEMLLRNADPVDATVLRNHFDRADHHQPIPVGRLPLEHPLILDGFSEDALNQRTSRAIKKLEHAPRSIVRRPHPISLADLICEGESPDA